ncbi:hypothetical protein KL927_000243 [Ogataea polymorpha]|nr:hypothetical protein KL927_000243 [Ogataea polymorpha]
MANPPVKPIPVVMEPSGYLTRMFKINQGTDYVPPEDAAAPTSESHTKFYLYKFDESSPNGQKIPLINSKSYYTIGKDPQTNDIVVADELVSANHAVLQFRSKNSEVTAYIIDLDSTNGTFINDHELPPNRYVQVLHKDVLRFGDPESQTEFVFIRD